LFTWECAVERVIRMSCQIPVLQKLLQLGVMSRKMNKAECFFFG
jgi:hypothetical protein